MKKPITKHCTIIYKENDKSIQNIAKAIKNAENKNKKLFSITPQKYYINIAYSNKEYDKKTGLVGTKTPRGGYAKKNRIILISPEIKKFPFDYESFFYHEINHIFYTTLVKNYHPVWFSEGMATCLMKTYNVDIKGWKTYFKSVNSPEKYLYYRYIKKKYYKNFNKFYTLSFLVYRYLDKTYGSKKIMKLLKQFSKNPTKNNFDKLLMKYFKQDIKEIVKSCIQ